MGGGANVSTSLLKKMLTGPLNSLFRRSSQRSGDRNGKRHGKKAEATLNSPAEIKRVNLVKEEKIVKITELKRQMESLENLWLTKYSFTGVLK